MASVASMDPTAEQSEHVVREIQRFSEQGGIQSFIEKVDAIVDRAWAEYLNEEEPWGDSDTAREQFAR